jgi:hypothetical protein
MKHRSMIANLLLCPALLVGCGGGGSGGGGGSKYMMSMYLSSAPGETALSSYLQAAHQSTLNASYSGTNYQLQVGSTPGAGTTTFNGSSPAYSVVDNITVSKDGAVLATDTSTDSFLLNPFVPLGEVASTGTPYAVVTSSTPLPGTLDAGGSGSFYTLTLYHDSTKAVMDATETVTYSAMANNSTTLLLCLDYTISDVSAQGTMDGLTSATENDCYTVDSAGTAALSSVTVVVDGQTLTFM